MKTRGKLLGNEGFRSGNEQVKKEVRRSVITARRSGGGGGGGQTSVRKNHPQTKERFPSSWRHNLQHKKEEITKRGKANEGLVEWGGSTIEMATHGSPNNFFDPGTVVTLCWLRQTGP